MPHFELALELLKLILQAAQIAATIWATSRRRYNNNNN